MPQCALRTNSLSMLKYIIELSLYSEFLYDILHAPGPCHGNGFYVK
jgi:hypothetical protein